MSVLPAGHLRWDGSLPAAPQQIQPNPPRPARRAWLAPLRDRGLRVASLLTFVCALSLTDLALTMTYVQGFGMFEGNPVVLKLIGTSSPLAMISWKLGTMLIAISILFWQRRTWQAEAAAVLGVVIYGGLLLHWHRYMDEIQTHTSALSVIAHEAKQPKAHQLAAFSGGSKWVSLPE